MDDNELTGIGCDRLLEVKRRKYDTSKYGIQWEGACKLVTAEQWQEYQTLKALPVHEMTVEEVEEIFFVAWFNEDGDNRLRAAAKALARLGAIRVVEEK